MNQLPPNVKIVATTTWNRYFGDPQSGGGMIGHVTHIRVNGVDAFVRENCRMDTFMQNSCQRRGIALGTSNFEGVQLLELATAGQWDVIAAVVHEVDGLNRRVVLNREWNVKAALRLFKRKGRGA